MFAEHSVNRSARRKVGRKADQILPLQRFQLDGFLFGQGMPRMTDQHERFLAQRNNFQLRVSDRKRNEAQVHNVALDILINLLGVAVLDMHVHGGVTPHIFFEIGRENMQANRIHAGHPEGARNDLFQFLQPAVKRRIGLQDPLAAIIKHLAFAGEAELFPAALKERRLENALQCAHLLADGRLGDTVDSRGLGETFGFDEVAENLETFDLHKQRLNIK